MTNTNTSRLNSEDQATQKLTLSYFLIHMPEVTLCVKTKTNGLQGWYYGKSVNGTGQSFTALGL